MKHDPMISVFRSAISGADGEVNAGYLALFWVMVVVLGVIPFALVLTGVQTYYDPLHKPDLNQLGVAVGAVAAGFATVLAALGVFLRGDRPPAPTLMAPNSPQIGQVVNNMADESVAKPAAVKAAKSAKR